MIHRAEIELGFGVRTSQERERKVESNSKVESDGYSALVIIGAYFPKRFIPEMIQSVALEGYFGKILDLGDRARCYYS